MPSIPTELKNQIEAAFDYRGYVTVRFKSGDAVEGFLFNRIYANSKLKEDHFIDVFIKSTGKNERYPMASLESIALTGEDCAAGKSYADYLKKKQQEAEKN